MKAEQEDNYEEALYRLEGLVNVLYGGYYEPKSDRDKELADALHDVWVKFQYSEETLKTFEAISDPKNKHLFTKEMAKKMFVYQNKFTK